MRSIAILASLLPATAVAFLPIPHNSIATSALAAISKPVDDSVIDLDRAMFCADHFGECSLDEMERMRNGESVFVLDTFPAYLLHSHTYHVTLAQTNKALHQERVSHVFTNADGLQNPHGLEEDIEHKLLESELTLQMGLLQDKLATEHMQEDTMAAYGANPYSSTMSLPVLDGGLDEESSETLMICLAIAGMAFLPQLFGN